MKYSVVGFLFYLLFIFHAEGGSFLDIHGDRSMKNELSIKGNLNYRIEVRIPLLDNIDSTDILYILAPTVNLPKKIDDYKKLYLIGKNFPLKYEEEKSNSKTTVFSFPRHELLKKNNDALIKNAVIVIHELSLDGHPEYYGSAILYKIKDNIAYFLAAAHEIPNFKDYDKLRLNGDICKNMPPKVVGISLADDIAILSVDITTLSEKKRNQFTKKIIPSAFHNNIDGPNHGPISIVGVKDWSEKKTMEMKHPYETRLLNMEKTVEDEKYLKTNILKYDYAAPIKLFPLNDDCPAYGLKTCYLADIYSWGYSGGALITTYFGDENNKSAIFAMITHFSFLTEKTYMIPIQDAITIGDELIKNKEARKFIRNSSGERIFEVLNENSVLVVAGSLKGKKVTSKTLFSKAGGDNGGGGGSGSLKSLSIGNFLGPNAEKLLNSFSTQTAPGIKGINTLLNYEPGIRINGQNVIAMKAESIIKIDSLSDFIHEYLKNPRLEIFTPVEKITLPLTLNESLPFLGFQIGNFPKLFSNILAFNSEISIIDVKGVMHTILGFKNIKISEKNHLCYESKEFLYLGNINWKQFGARGLRAEVDFTSQLINKTTELIHGNILEESEVQRKNKAILFVIPDEKIKGKGSMFHLKMIRYYQEPGGNGEFLEGVAIPFELKENEVFY